MIELSNLLLISFKKIRLSIDWNKYDTSFFPQHHNYLTSSKKYTLYRSQTCRSFFSSSSSTLFQQHNRYIIPILQINVSRFPRDRRVGVQRTDKERRRNGEGEKEEKLTSAEKITSLSIACQTNGTSRVSFLDRLARKSRFRFPIHSHVLRRAFENRWKISSREFRRVNGERRSVPCLRFVRDLKLFLKFHALIIRSRKLRGKKKEREKNKRVGGMKYCWRISLELWGGKATRKSCFANLFRVGGLLEWTVGVLVAISCSPPFCASSGNPFLSFLGNAFYGERDGIEWTFVEFLSVKDGHVLRALLENLCVRVRVLF